MSIDHRGNIQNEITFEEHDGTLNAKRVSLVGNVSITATSNVTVFIGNPTLFAVVNTAAAGQASIVLDNSIARIGFATVNVANSQANTGNVTLNPGPNFIGIVTVANPGSSTGNVTLDPGSLTGIAGNLTLSDSKGFIGLTTVVQASSVRSIVGNVTVQAVDLDIRNLSSAQDNVAIIGNLTLSDPKGFIGLVTVVGSLSPAAGNITLDPGSRTGILGNLTLSDSKGFIGLVTSTLDINKVSGVAANVTVHSGIPVFGVRNDSGSSSFTNANGDFSPFGVDEFGSVNAQIIGGTISSVGSINTINDPVALKGNLTLSDSRGFIGLTSIQGNVNLNAGVNNIGFASVTPIAAWPDPKGYIGLVTITGALSAAAGNITLDPGSRTGLVGTVTIQDGGNSITIDGNVGVLGNVTLSDSKTFIGLTTTVVGSALPAGANFIGLVTVVGSLSPAAGNVTLDAGSRTGILGNLTLSDSKTFIGLVSVTGTVGINAGIAGIGFATVALGAGNSNIGDVDVASIAAGANYVGLASVNIGGTLPALTAGIANIGFATVFNATAWPDPKTYIGLVTITGALSPAAGNITLDPGSRTGLVGTVTIQDGGNSITIDGSVGVIGNVTLSDSKGYIGLVTVTQASSARTITGNVTLDVGSLVGIRGNLTLSDPKGFIGLVTIVGSLSPAAGNITLDAGSLTGIRGNLTLSDSKGFIGLVTVVQSSAARTITGNLTLSDSKGFIGLTTTVNGVGTSFIGLVTVVQSSAARTITGNLTLSDSRGFIGLSTVKASVLDTFSSLATFTMSIASLATSTTGVGRQSTLIDNSTNNYSSAMVYLKVFSGGLAHTPNSMVNVFLLRRDNNSVGDDGVGASDAAATFVNAPLLGNILVSASNISTAYYGVFDTSPLGPLGPQWGVGVVNVSGAALGGTESNHLKNWIGVNRRLT